MPKTSKRKKDKGKKCFVNPWCSYDCPNAKIEEIDAYWGAGIADDCGYTKIKCKDCRYGDLHECKDCYLFNSKECPERAKEMGETI